MKKLQSFLSHSSAVIFDMDGVIAATEPLKFLSYQLVFRRNFQVELPTTDISWRGQAESVVVTHWLNLFELKGKIRALVNQKRRVYQRLLKTAPLKPVPGLMKFLKHIRHLNIRCGLATGSTHHDAQLILSRLDLVQYFDAAVTVEEVARPKPHPDTYRIIAGKLNVSPQSCIVFEDSPAGVSAAKALGMNCIALTTSFTASDLSQADTVIKDFISILEIARHTQTSHHNKSLRR